MAKNDKKNGVPVGDTAEATEPVAAEVPESTAKSVEVVTKRGVHVRTFSLAAHGKDFAKNAAEFAEKFNHEVKKPAK